MTDDATEPTLLKEDARLLQQLAKRLLAPPEGAGATEAGGLRDIAALKEELQKSRLVLHALGEKVEGLKEQVADIKECVDQVPGEAWHHMGSFTNWQELANVDETIDELRDADHDLERRCTDAEEAIEDRCLTGSQSALLEVLEMAIRQVKGEDE